MVAVNRSRRPHFEDNLDEEESVWPRRPTFDLPTLPIAITELADDGLMKLLSKLTRYQDYLSGELAKSEIAEGTAKTILDRIDAEQLVLFWGSKEKGDNITVIKEQAKLTPKRTKAEDDYAVKHAHRKLMGVLVGTVERDAFVVSREISRRTGRQEVHDRRTSKWGGA